MPLPKPPDQGDRSLRPNGSTYRNSNGESKLLVQRLTRSTASVIGIAGPRGAGKSSLAQCVLGERTEAGAFTQVIHAPTSYEPAEFLVAVSQRICEGVIADVDTGLQRGDSVSVRGKTAVRRIVARCLVLGAVALAVGAMGPRAVDYWREDGLGTLLENGVVGFASQGVVWGAVVGLAVWIVRGLLQVPRGERARLKVGLRSLAVEFLERLRYQSTRSFAARTGVLNSTFNIGQSLADRPLSIPGLADQLSRFLGQVAEAYGEPVVICLDELDKITEPEELDKLLRGIKGVLGQPQTHFILTVSEDALTRFAARHWADRGIVESAFEDVVFLNIVSHDTARGIVGLMHDRAPLEGEWTIAGELMWVFGGGIPREIKRNTRMCLEANQQPAVATAKAYVIWKTLFRARVEEITQWTLRAGSEWELTYNFVRSLEHSASQVEEALGDEPPNMEWARALVGPWVGNMDSLAAAAGRREAGAVALGQAAVAIIVGGSAVVYTLNKDAAQLDEESMGRLYRIFELGRLDLKHTRDLLGSYLEEIGLGAA